jgi:hypothetical protein
LTVELKRAVDPAEVEAALVEALAKVRVDREGETVAA